MRVRWIDVWGISWDVISALALRPAPAGARRRPPPRSKADYCSQHLFIRILVYTLTSSSSSPSFSDDRAPEDTSSADTFTGMPLSESPAQIDDEEEDDLNHRACCGTRTTWMTRRSWGGYMSHKARI
ncbi:hypothetical protein DICSQDRAFT_141329 [Dichomitus squalens LYAD-421 SS1]|uniref:Uncharacterized protein n=2 Tax=Dichomitus squalens TaxID=114155 RepID=A0A4V2JYH1_9APHY|nr:uncharacterized protein DICSQDRAFT_141329 [Dichomitus squalens LYAD-421 SS1]EJF56315.1 hypothetical protein DICSQDRAFT_141329 [Dichomitus squalens LYAD-421 SS1]TBU21103.1 hypothetical protein BD311DRAFT_707218 [Dichomitus squalens]TBU21133.1 hypothetical protein BD311DRAFT_679267 [Dichomitus squalens]